MVEFIGSVLSSAIATPKMDGAVGKLAQLDASQRFTSSLRSAADVARPAGASAPGEVQKAPDLHPNVRARRAAQVEASAPGHAATGGDNILDGLQKLRGIFDKQQMRVNKAMSGSMNDMTTLLNVQMEVVNYSLLVDVTSKLTGKSTQAFETLLKGQ